VQVRVRFLDSAWCYGPSHESRSEPLESWSVRACYESSQDTDYYHWCRCGYGFRVL
uniref:Uncharacterized protein n=1 Tax=Cannabis sativa TaxID=3483 RepID=A0A803QRZ4_CANSA